MTDTHQTQTGLKESRLKISTYDKYQALRRSKLYRSDFNKYVAMRGEEKDMSIIDPPSFSVKLCDAGKRL